MTLMVDRVTCWRGGIPLFTDLSFSLLPSQIMHLQGPNGIGKTTLLEGLAGLISFDAGFFTQCDTHYVGLQKGMKRDLSVAENLAFWASVYRQPKSSVMSSLKAFELEGLSNSLFKHLSTGQAQRVSLARLILIKRSLWLLDEPFSGLDQRGKALLEDQIEHHLRQKGMILYASHEEGLKRQKPPHLNLEDYLLRSEMIREAICA